MGPKSCRPALRDVLMRYNELEAHYVTGYKSRNAV